MWIVWSFSCCRGLDYLNPLTNLEDLDLSDTGVSDKGIFYLGKLTSLSALSVSHTGKVHSKNREVSVFLDTSKFLVFLHVSDPSIWFSTGQSLQIIGSPLIREQTYCPHVFHITYTDWDILMIFWEYQAKEVWGVLISKEIGFLSTFAIFPSLNSSIQSLIDLTHLTFLTKPHTIIDIWPTVLKRDQGQIWGLFSVVSFNQVQQDFVCRSHWRWFETSGFVW